MKYRPKNDDTHEFFPPGKCFRCGEKATAMWHSLSIVEVCHSCAVEVLPKLIADATFHASSNYSGSRILERVRSEFWKAVASNYSVEMRKIEKERRAARQARLEENRAVMCPACE